MRDLVAGVACLCLLGCSDGAAPSAAIATSDGHSAAIDAQASLSAGCAVGCGPAQAAVPVALELAWADKTVPWIYSIAVDGSRLVGIGLLEGGGGPSVPVWMSADPSRGEPISLRPFPSPFFPGKLINHKGTMVFSGTDAAHGAFLQSGVQAADWRLEAGLDFFSSAGLVQLGSGSLGWVVCRHGTFKCELREVSDGVAIGVIPLKPRYILGAVVPRIGSGVVVAGWSSDAKSATNPRHWPGEFLVEAVSGGGAEWQRAVPAEWDDWPRYGAVAADGSVVVGTDKDRVMAFSPDDGEIRWSVTLPDNELELAALVPMPDGLIAVARRPGVVLWKGRLYGIDLYGKIQWDRDLGMHRVSDAVGYCGGLVLAGDRTSEMSAWSIAFRLALVSETGAQSCAGDGPCNGMACYAGTCAAGRCGAGL